MAFSSLLDIVSRAADELGLPRPSVVVGSTQPQDRQLLAAANASGRDLMRSHEWGLLRNTGSFTTVASTVGYALASDFDRMVSDTSWNRATGVMLSGPDTPQTYRFLNDSGTAAVSTHQRFIVKGGFVYIWPTPDTAETLGYEYISNLWALTNAAVGQTEFGADTDTTVFDPDLMKMEIKWRFMAGKGMYADGLKAEAMLLRDSRIAADLGGSVLNMNNTPSDMFVGMGNIPDGSWDIT